MFFRFLTFCLCTAILPAEPVTSVRTLSLQDVAQIALAHHFGLQNSRLNVEDAQLAIQQAEADLDLRLGADIGYRERRSPQGPTDQSGNSNPSAENITSSVSLSKRTSLGSRIDLSAANNYSSFSDDVSSDLTVTLIQPLLAGAGRTTNLAHVFRRQIQSQSALLQYRNQVLDVLQGVTNAYWDLALAQEEGRVIDASMAVAENLLAENTRRRELGLATDIEVLQAEVSVQELQESKVLARQNLLNLSDQLYRLMGSQVVSQDSIIVQSLPQITPHVPEFALWFETLQDKDLSLKIIENNLAISARDLEVAQRNLLPSLSIRASASALGRDESISSAYESAIARDGYTWNTSLALSMPWGRQAEKARMRSAQISQRREEIRREEERVSIQIAAQRVLRNLESNALRLEVSEAQVAMREKLFAQQRARYRAGSDSFREVLLSQREYENAQLRFLRSIRELHRNDTLRARLDHEILERFGFHWDDTL